MLLRQLQNLECNFLRKLFLQTLHHYCHIDAEKTETNYTVPLCVPVYHSFPSIVQGLYSVNDGIGDFGSLAPGDLYENLSDEEKNKLEKIYEEESELRKIEIENTEKTRIIILSLIIVGIIGGIVGGIVFMFRRKRK